LGITFTLRINNQLFHLMTILLCFGFNVGYRQGRTLGGGVKTSLELDILRKLYYLCKGD